MIVAPSLASPHLSPHFVAPTARLECLRSDQIDYMMLGKLFS
jgi:hypothetical protein